VQYSFTFSCVYVIVTLPNYYSKMPSRKTKYKRKYRNEGEAVHSNSSKTFGIEYTRSNGGNLFLNAE